MLTKAEAESVARMDTCPVYLDEDATMQEILRDYCLNVIRDYGGHLMLVNDAHGKQIVLSGDPQGRNVHAHILLPGWEASKEG